MKPVRNAPMISALLYGTDNLALNDFAHATPELAARKKTHSMVIATDPRQVAQRYGWSKPVDEVHLIGSAAEIKAWFPLFEETASKIYEWPVEDWDAVPRSWRDGKYGQ